MKYFYKKDNNEWGTVHNRIFLFFFCSIKGTETWCENDCKNQDEKKHLFPDPCPQRKYRKGLKDTWLLKRLKKVFTRKGAIISFAISSFLGLTITINKCVLVEEINIVWKYEDIQGSVNNKNAKFRIAIVTQEYRWKLARADSIESGLIFIELPKLLDNLDKFDNAIGLVSVGCASQEGTQEDEVSRAERRADNILTILRQHRKTKNANSLYKLNLGQYRTTRRNQSETSVQRRVIIIGVLEKDKNMSEVEIGKALKNALQESSLKFTVNVDSYSNFDFLPMQNE